MIEHHIPHGIVGGEFGRFEDHKLIFASCLTDEEGEGIDKLLSYVKNGGRLIFRSLMTLSMRFNALLISDLFIFLSFSPPYVSIQRERKFVDKGAISGPMGSCSPLVADSPENARNAK